jgi:hypothetical protein
MMKWSQHAIYLLQHWILTITIRQKAVAFQDDQIGVSLKNRWFSTVRHGAAILERQVLMM